MDLSITSLLLALPIFFLAYQGMDLFLESRRGGTWNGRRPAHGAAATAGKSIGSRLTFNRIFLDKPKFREHLEMRLLRTGNVNGWTPADLLFYQEAAGVGLALILWL